MWIIWPAQHLTWTPHLSVYPPKNLSSAIKLHITLSWNFVQATVSLTKIGSVRVILYIRQQMNFYLHFPHLLSNLDEIWHNRSTCNADMRFWLSHISLQGTSCDRHNANTITKEIHCIMFIHFSLERVKKTIKVTLDWSNQSSLCWTTSLATNLYIFYDIGYKAGTKTEPRWVACCIITGRLGTLHLSPPSRFHCIQQTQLIVLGCLLFHLFIPLKKRMEWSLICSLWTSLELSCTQNVLKIQTEGGRTCSLEQAVLYYICQLGQQYFMTLQPGTWCTMIMAR